MVNCFLTGVQIHFNEAFVLNRREVRELHDILKERVASLRRLIEQFAPLDEKDKELFPPFDNPKAAPKKHRLVCKAVAAALAPGFPEIKLFVCWPEYQSQSRQTALQGVNDHPLFDGAVKQLDDKELRQADKLGKRVMNILDSKHAVPPQVRQAIAFGIGVFNRRHNPDHVVRLVREAAAATGEPHAIGISPDELAILRNILTDPLNSKTPQPSAHTSVVAK